MIRDTSVLYRGPLTALMAVFLVFVAAYIYVGAFAIGYRPVVLVIGGAFFFLGCTLFARELRQFLVFAALFCIPLQFGYHVVHIPLVDSEVQPFASGIAIDSVDVIVLLLYVHWAFLLSAKRVSGFTLGNPVGGLLLSWIAFCLVTSLWLSQALEYSIFEIVVLFKGFLLYFYLVNNTRTEEDVKVIVAALIVGAVAHSVYIIGQFVTGWNYTIHGVLETYVGPEGFRSVGFFGSPDAASAMMSLVLPILICFLFVQKSRPLRVLAVVSIASIIVALMCTKVRATAGALLVSTTIVVMVSYTRGWVSQRTVLAFTVVGLLVVAVLSPFLYERFAKGTWGEDRMPLAFTAVNMFWEHWIGGIGINNYHVAFQRYLPQEYRYTWPYVVHIEYLYRLAETGIVGFTLYYAMIVAMMVKLWRGLRTSVPWVFVLSLGIFSGMTGSLFHRFFSAYHYVNLFIFFCVLLALAVTADRYGRAEATVEADKAGVPGTKR
ncbi:MAG: O-antigen ligase family protein [Desulfomonilaceae bacterium]|nr:O-antigen ligase family protein [Desulfomonilaceae bacterium]